MRSYLCVHKVAIITLITPTNHNNKDIYHMCIDDIIWISIQLKDTITFHVILKKKKKKKDFMKGGQGLRSMMLSHH